MGLDRGEVDLDERIVVGDACGLELAVVVSTLVQVEPRLRVTIGLPDARSGRSFRSS